jgi:DNA-binding IclR family transcriptional regulator
MKVAADPLLAHLPTDAAKGLSVAELCDAADLTDAEARRRLRKGQDAGLVEQTKTGGRVKFFRTKGSTE